MSNYVGGDGLFESCFITSKMKKEQEKPQPNSIGCTQGRKGMKLNRINMGFSDVNYEFIRFQARYKGLTMTQFVNGIIDNFRKEN